DAPPDRGGLERLLALQVFLRKRAAALQGLERARVGFQTLVEFDHDVIGRAAPTGDDIVARLLVARDHFVEAHDPIPELARVVPNHPGKSSFTLAIPPKGTNLYR